MHMQHLEGLCKFCAAAAFSLALQLVLFGITTGFQVTCAVRLSFSEVEAASGTHNVIVARTTPHATNVLPQQAEGLNRACDIQLPL